MLSLSAFPKIRGYVTVIFTVLAIFGYKDQEEQQIVIRG